MYKRQIQKQLAKVVQSHYKSGELGQEYDGNYPVSYTHLLRKQYGTLEKLNEAWGTTFWNQTYTAWDQIYVLRPVLTRGINPHQHLDYIRFISESARHFCKMQAEIIKKYVKPGDYITTNGKFWNLDNHKMEKESLEMCIRDSLYPGTLCSTR